MTTLWLALLVACPKIPDHLQLDDHDTPTAPDVVVTDLASALDALLGADPLARSRRAVNADTLATVADAAPVASSLGVIDAHTGATLTPGVLHDLERAHDPGAAVGFIRGERLAQVEAALSIDSSNVGARSALLWMAPLAPHPDANTLTRPPLEWLTSDEDPQRALQAWGDRHVLLGWLTPGVPLTPVSRRLQASPFDSLRGSPTGRLLMASSAWVDTPRDPAVAEAMWLATELVLLDAAADRDAERKAWRARRAELAALHGERPERALLNAAIDGASATGHPADVGLGLIAAQGLRWLNACAWQPCGGLDRTTEVGRARRWSTEASELAGLWQLAMLEQALDGVEVAQGTQRFAPALADLADVLIGLAPGPVDESLLRRRTNSAAVWHSVQRSLDVEGPPDLAHTRLDLNALLASIAAETTLERPHPSIDDAVARIRRRALP